MDTLEPPSRTRDEWIALRCQSGEPSAFEDLIATMERPLLYYATKLTGSAETALDIVQEVWLRAFQGIRRLGNPGSLRPWLYRITHGLAIDHIRQEVSRHRVEEEQVLAFQEIDEPCFRTEDAAAIHDGLNELEPKHREVLTLFFLEDFSVAEVAAILDCSEGTVKSRLHYAKKTMKEILTGGGYGTSK